MYICVYVCMYICMYVCMYAYVCIYRYKKIHCIIVRGSHFCPSALECISSHLGVARNNMIMGVPSSAFPFPFAKLKGVRLAVPFAEPEVVHETYHRLKGMFDELHDVEQRGGANV